MKPVILHSDMNNFYASVEILYDPALRDKPVAVAGDEEARHGIVLAKNDIAKRLGIHTGQVLWEARQQCPELVCVPAHYERYLAFSAQAREIYTSYTDQVESFGLDECWLDVTGSVGLFGDGPTIANDIRGRIRRELGLTVSVGVSFNKVFAKLGSDMKKPDAITVITPENYRERAWSLPVSDLLYVGPATTRKLNQYGITTIGELARANLDLLYWLLGKNGIMLHQFANGQDHSGVRRYYAVPPMKSIGNSTTAPRDLVSEDDVKITLMALCESVGARLREQGCACSTITVSIRDNRLLSYGRQIKLPQPTANTLDIWEAALELFRRHHTGGALVRSLAVKAGGLSPAGEMEQLSLFPEEQKAQRRAAIDQTLDKLRGKYGYFCVRRGITLVDPALDLDAREEHIIHPIGFLGTLHE
ncbi:MAG: DNA polymerase IV [Oscillospiraceae bacterium]|nr:DNA polymerase IV [Oscillospiraceae bacterium]